MLLPPFYSCRTKAHQSQACGISLFGVFVFGSSRWVSSIVSALSTFKSQLKLTPAAAIRTQYPSKFGHRLTALGIQDMRNSSKRPSCTKSEDLSSFIRQHRWNPAHFTTGCGFFYFCPIASVICLPALEKNGVTFCTEKNFTDCTGLTHSQGLEQWINQGFGAGWWKLPHLKYFKDTSLFRYPKLHITAIMLLHLSIS